MSSDPRAAEVFGEGYDDVCRYVDILGSRGIEWGLLGPRESERLWDRHVLNSAALASVVPEGSFVVDVGSGAGLPGIPLALARPDLTITLLEPLQRRYEFLEGVIDELGLEDRVRVLRQRAEEHHESYDVVTCRAVARLEKLLGWCAPLFPDGELLALKGERVYAELEDAAGDLRRRGLRGDVVQVRAHTDVEPTFVARLRHVDRLDVL